ncbi:hypothetical protein M4L38_01155 [Staphylococcus equorum]|uniref:hypothetical protein n=1 Tax=Staphylococcus equorum TaxID=246432 RepID=UPI002407DF09|nr:hypothetical protein [Staphylococcus equorum]MDG0821373.1 hypothetical protein [Staphylococcus equorum]
MNQAIENCIQELVSLTNGSYQDIKEITSVEFSKTPFDKTKHNYFVFIENLKSNELNHMLNQFLLCKEG